MAARADSVASAAEGLCQLSPAKAAAMQAQAAAQANADARFAAGGPDFEPIGGVSLDLYAEISRGASPPRTGRPRWTAGTAA